MNTVPFMPLLVNMRVTLLSGGTKVIILMRPKKHVMDLNAYYHMY